MHMYVTWNNSAKTTSVAYLKLGRNSRRTVIKTNDQKIVAKTETTEAALVAALEISQFSL